MPTHYNHYTLSEIKQVLEWGAKGFGPSAIARVTGIPRRTLSDWLRKYAGMDEAAIAMVKPGYKAYDFTYL